MDIKLDPKVLENSATSADSNTDVKQNLAILDDLSNKLNRINFPENISDLEGVNATRSNLELLGDIARNVPTANPSVDPIRARISDTLSGAISDYSLQIADITKWNILNQSGIYSEALRTMLEYYQSLESLTPLQQQDLFQLLILEALTNPEYGLLEKVDNPDQFISDILTRIGSGSLSLDTSKGDELTTAINQVLLGILNGNATGTLPPDSTAAQAAALLFKGLNINNYNDIASKFSASILEQAGKTGTNTTNATNINSTVRMALLSDLLAKNLLDSDQIDTILNGSLSQVNALLTELDVIKDGESAFTYLTSVDSNWNISSSGTLTYNGDSFGSTQITDLISQLQPASISEETLQQLNNLGDKVKAIEESLKYWITLIKDSMLAMARNI